MSGSMVFILIAAVVGCVIVAVVAYYLARSMRGSIKLFLARTAFNPGESITGSFDLQTKKPIQGNKLIVSLIGVQVTEVYKDGKTETRTHEIYRDEHVIEGAKSYDAGHTAKHEFQLAVPNTGTSELMNSALGQILGATSALLNSSRTDLKWKVEARLDAKGIDLATSTPVWINLQG
jgi:hypothetical protein